MSFRRIPKALGSHTEILDNLSLDDLKLAYERGASGLRGWRAAWPKEVWVVYDHGNVLKDTEEGIVQLDPADSEAADWVLEKFGAYGSLLS